MIFFLNRHLYVAVVMQINYYYRYYYYYYYVSISHWWPMTAPLHQKGTGQSTYGHIQAFTTMKCTALKGVVML